MAVPSFDNEGIAMRALTPQVFRLFLRPDLRAPTAIRSGDSVGVLLAKPGPVQRTPFTKPARKLRKIMAQSPRPISGYYGWLASGRRANKTPAAPRSTWTLSVFLAPHPEVLFRGA